MLATRLKPAEEDGTAANGTQPAAMADPSPVPVSSGSHTSKTAELARTLAGYAEGARALGRVADAEMFGRVAKRLALCGAMNGATRGPRCGHPVCPRCEGRKARRQREGLEVRLHAVEGRAAMLTLTAPADTLAASLTALQRASKTLRRRALWHRNIDGGELHVEVVRTRDGAARKWNVHVHGIVTFRASAAVKDVAVLGAGLAAMWRIILAAGGLTGAVDLQRLARLAPDGRATWVRYAARFGEDRIVNRAAFYVTERVPDRAVGALHHLEDVAAFVRFLEGGPSGLRRVNKFGNWRKRGAARTPDDLQRHRRNPMAEVAKQSPSKLWTVADVAEFLAVSESWVYLHAGQGDLPYRRVGGMLRFFPADVEAYTRGENVTGVNVVALRKAKT